jgi:hypothetical protein
MVTKGEMSTTGSRLSYVLASAPLNKFDIAQHVGQPLECHDSLYLNLANQSATGLQTGAIQYQL